MYQHFGQSYRKQGGTDKLKITISRNAEGYYNVLITAYWNDGHATCDTCQKETDCIRKPLDIDKHEDEACGCVKESALVQDGILYDTLH